jgi:hypothetical protein
MRHQARLTRIERQLASVATAERSSGPVAELFRAVTFDQAADPIGCNQRLLVFGYLASRELQHGLSEIDSLHAAATREHSRCAAELEAMGVLQPSRAAGCFAELVLMGVFDLEDCPEWSDDAAAMIRSYDRQGYSARFLSIQPRIERAFQRLVQRGRGRRQMPEK